MRTLVRTSQFKKDFKRLRSSGRNLEKLASVITMLQHDEPLPEAFRDHTLIGQWSDHRECHLAGDWLLIYRLVENDLVLVRAGSHTELFD